MGRKRNIVMDETQEEQLNQRSTNKYTSGSAYDLPEEFAMIAALDKKDTTEATETPVQEEKKAAAKRRQRVRSKRFVNLKNKIDVQKTYSLSEAVHTVLDLAKEKFDASIELNLITKKENVSGNVTLPHGTGKEKKIAVVNDDVLKQIEDKKIDFDVLVAKPEDMPKLAKHAKFLGPRGLMPNPKNGTIAADPQKAAAQLGGNTVNYKTEKKAPLIHLIVGKKSFGEEKLTENVKAVFSAINPRQVKGASISSSMGPGVKVDVMSALQ